MRRSYNLFDAIFDMFPVSMEFDWVTPTDLKLNYNECNTENEYIFTIDVPGFSKDQLKMKLNRGELHITGKREETSSNSKAMSNFSYSVEVPEDLRSEDVKAEVKDGRMTVSFPKKVAALPPPQEIDIL